MSAFAAERWRTAALETLAETVVRAVILILLLVGCTSPQPDSAASSTTSDSWPRCYALRTGAWTPPPGQPVHVTHAPPQIVHLDTQQVGRDVERVARRRRLAPHIPALSRGGFLAPGWVRVAPDSLELMWSSGYEGLRVVLRERGDSVEGSARTFTDYGAEALAPVTGWRIACPRDYPAG
jgi:hypothetical protein